MSLRDDVEDPLQFATHLPIYAYRVLFRRNRPLNLPLSFEIVEKGDFGAPDLYEEEILQILDMHFQIAHTSDHVAGYG